MPSISPGAEAGACKVPVSRLGSGAVGISWPRSARKLEIPTPATPRLNHRGPPVSPGPVSAAIAGNSTVRATRQATSRRSANREVLTLQDQLMAGFALILAAPLLGSAYRQGPEVVTRIRQTPKE